MTILFFIMRISPCTIIGRRLCLVMTILFFIMRISPSPSFKGGEKRIKYLAVRRCVRDTMPRRITLYPVA